MSHETELGVLRNGKTTIGAFRDISGSLDGDCEGHLPSSGNRRKVDKHQPECTVSHLRRQKSTAITRLVIVTEMQFVSHELLTELYVLLVRRRKARMKKNH
jgi:hypothetical protein